MKCKILINKYSIFLLILIIISIFINFNWIKNDERPPSYEDLVLLGHLPSLYHKDLISIGLYKEILVLKYPPVIPSLILISFKIFGPSFDSALYVNLLFWPVLILSCFFLGKKFYNEKVGLLAAFILSTLPPIILFSRTTYPQFILVSLVTLNLALFAYTDWFKNSKFSILYGFSFAICLLARYTSLPYIIVPPIFFFFFKSGIFKEKFLLKNLIKNKIKRKTIILNSIKFILILTTFLLFLFFGNFYLDNFFLIFFMSIFILFILTTLTKRSVINNFMDCFLIVLIVILPWYLNKFVFLMELYIPCLNKFASQTNLYTKNNFVHYIIFLINYQVGFINFLIFVFIIIFLFISYYREKRINQNDLLFLFIFIFSYLFYTLIPLKNTTVTTCLLIPFSFIVSRGIFKLPKTVKYVFLLIIIFTGLFYLLPFQSFNKTAIIGYEGIQIKIPFSNFDTVSDAPNTFVIFSKDRDISLHFSRNSRFYILKNENKIKEISEFIYKILKTKNCTEVKSLFLFRDFYIYQDSLDYNLRLWSIDSSSFSCLYSNFYEEFNVSKNLSDIQNTEKYFEWIYDFDFIFVIDIKNNEKIPDTFNESPFGENCLTICSYTKTSKRFKNEFKLLYQTKISDKEKIIIYENI